MISDLTPLKGLINLTRLDLYQNQISDLSPLKGLINLTELSLSRNQIIDWSPVAHVQIVYGRPDDWSDNTPTDTIKSANLITGESGGSYSPEDGSLVPSYIFSNGGKCFIFQGIGLSSETTYTLKGNILTIDGSYGGEYVVSEGYITNSETGKKWIVEIDGKESTPASSPTPKATPTPTPKATPKSISIDDLMDSGDTTGSWTSESGNTTIIFEKYSSTATFIDNNYNVITMSFKLDGGKIEFINVNTKKSTGVVEIYMDGKSLVLDGDKFYRS
jgi:Leucine-rich repeat (LRR) protein